MLTVATVAMGAVFASAEVSAVAFCGQHGARGASGVALAAIWSPPITPPRTLGLAMVELAESE